MFLELGDLFRKLMRFCYSKCSGICFCCGKRCGMVSHIHGGYMWCDSCHDEWRDLINNKKYYVGWKGIGIPITYKSLVNPKWPRK